MLRERSLGEIADREIGRLRALAARPKGPERNLLARRLRYAVARGLKQQMEDVLRVLRTHQKSTDADTILQDVDAVLARPVLRVPLTVGATRSWLLGARSANDDFEITPGVGATSPDLDTYIEHTLRPSIDGIHTFTRDRIHHIVASDLAAGIALTLIAAEVAAQRDAGVFSLARATGIGWYESDNGFLDGRRSAVRAHAARIGRALEKRWVTAGDQRVEAVCEANEAAGFLPDGQPYPSGHMGPLAHSHCRCDEEFHILDA